MGNDPEGSGKTDLSKRRLLRDLTALGVMGAAGLTVGTAFPEFAEAHPEVRELKPVDWSGLTEDQIEGVLKDFADIAGLLYHTYNGVRFFQHATDGWTHDKDNNATHTYAPWGGQCTILYNLHKSERSAAGVPPPDVVTLETYFVDKTISDLESGPPRIVQQHEVDLVNRTSPNTGFYFVDVGQTHWQDAMTGLGFALPAELVLVNTAGKFAKKLNTLGASALKFFALSGIATLMSSYIAQNAGGRTSDVIATFAKIQGDLPTIMTFLTTKIRNVLAAEKNYWLAKKFSEDRERAADLVTVWGAAHQGLEAETLRTSEERIAFLRRWKPLIKSLFMNPSDPAFLWTCLRREHYRDSGGNLWYMIEKPHFEVSTLKEIFSS